jgi:putative transposase
MRPCKRLTWRANGISKATLCNWKAKYGGMDVSDVKRLRLA